MIFANEKQSLKWLILGSGIIYLLSLRAYYVGFFNDDAFYIIGARALAQGRYVELNAPGQPPLVNYLPGYSLILVPVAWLAGNSLLPYQLLSVLMCLLALGLLWRLFEGLAPSARWAALAVSGFNPLMISMSGAVLSDIPFLLLTVIIFLYARKIWDKKPPRPWLILSGLAGFACLLRPTGVAVVLALLAALGLEKRWKLAALCAGVCTLVLSPFLLRNYFYTGQALMYAVELTDPYRGASAFGRFVFSFKENLGFYLKFLFVTTLFRWPWNLPLLEALTVGLGIAAVGYGIRDKREKLIGIYLLIYMLIHLLWSKQAGRYLFPVVPFFAAYLFQGLALKKRMIYGALGLSLFLSGLPAARIVRAGLWVRNPLNTPPRRAFEWIRGNTGPRDIFAAELDGRFYLYTGRLAVHLNRPNSDAGFLRWLDENRVGYIAVFPNDFVMRTSSGQSSSDPVSLDVLRKELSEKRLFTLVFEDKEEGSAIYRVTKRRGAR